MNDQNTKTEWAEQRTDWAEDRTILANERTFAGWMRTGMASVAVAIGLRAVIGEVEPDWYGQVVSSFFALLGIGIFWAAWRSACRTTDKLNTHRADRLSNATMTWIASSLSVGALGCGLLLLLL